MGLQKKTSSFDEVGESFQSAESTLGALETKSLTSDDQLHTMLVCVRAIYLHFKKIIQLCVLIH